MNSGPVVRPYFVTRPPVVPSVVLSRDGVDVVRWPLVGGVRPDLSLVERLSRLQLEARRLGYSIQVRDAGAACAGLLDLAGLAEVVGLDPRSVEVQGQAEDLEQVGVEEVVMPDDPSA